MEHAPDKLELLVGLLLAAACGEDAPARDTALDADAVEQTTIDSCLSVAAVVRAWRRGGSRALVVEPDEALAVIRGLTALANGEDAAADMEARRPLTKRDPEVIGAARAACAGLTGLALRVAASAAAPR